MVQNTDYQISSHRNPRVKHLRRLSNRRYRLSQEQFLIEGKREVQRAHENACPLLELFICPDFFPDAFSNTLVNGLRETGIPVFTIAPDVFKKVAYRDKPEGIIATARQKKNALDQINPQKTPLLVVAAALEKPGNLGAVLRSADATGVDAVIVCENNTDIFNPNVIRSSTGTVFSVPVVEASAENTFSWLREKHVTTVAATPEGTCNYTDVDLTRPVALIVGAEAEGLPEFWRRNAEITATIPMFGVADSLNVTNSATVILYEIIRQRSLTEGFQE